MLTIETRFISGRYSATRWGQDAFTDPYDEWPPSPWRFLRALHAVWKRFDTNHQDTTHETFLSLMSKMAGTTPEWRLPKASPLRIAQYVPRTGNKSTERGRDKLCNRQMFVNGPLYWLWDIDTSNGENGLLGELLGEMAYLGRAESLCECRIFDGEPEGVTCRLVEESGPESSPTLAWDAGREFDMELLIKDTMECNHLVPEGARWYKAESGEVLEDEPATEPHHPRNTMAIDLIGLVRPGPEIFTSVTNRVRGSILKAYRGILGIQKFSEADDATARLMTGKKANGKVAKDHEHPFFFVKDLGDRLRVYIHRKKAFSSDEVSAILLVAGKPVFWGKGEYPMTMVPTTIPPDEDILTTSKKWKSITPFVFPDRYTVDCNKGPGHRHSPERVMARLIEGTVGKKISSVKISGTAGPVKIHNTNPKGKERRHGVIAEIEFFENVEGPICGGESCHFGLGAFVPSL